MITVRRATLDDNKDFSELMLTSTPFLPILFGKEIKMVLRDLFQCHFNLFSFEHVYFAEVGGEKAGMILGYDWRVKKREGLRTGYLLFKRTGIGILSKFLRLLKLNAIVGRVSRSEYYLSNVATYPQYRGMGVGRRLMLEAEKEAKLVGAERIVLDVEKENVRAMNFYKKLGYRAIEEFSIPLQRDKILHFNRMAKKVK